LIARDLAAAQDREFDVVVIGGGILGACVLREAAHRGLSACLCEAGDFGSGTSWNSLRILHGGLRYLQSLDLRRFRESVAARREFALQFPTLIRRLETIMPLSSSGLRRPAVLRAALALNDALSARRNEGVESHLHLRPGRIVDANEVRSRLASSRADEWVGAACWDELVMTSPERIVLETLRTACREGALALNYVRVSSIETHAGAVTAVIARDVQGGMELRLRARSVADCTGPATDRLLRPGDPESRATYLPSLAFNLVLDRHAPVDAALAVAPPARGSPILFLLPHPRGVVAGTRHLPRTETGEPVSPTEAEVAEFLAMLNAAVPELQASAESVLQVQSGLLPVARAGSVKLTTRESFIDQRRSRPRGYCATAAIKFTTAPRVARRVLDRLGFTVRRRALPPVEPLPLSPDTALLTRALGSTADIDSALDGALERTVATESVLCVDDLVRRRTSWQGSGEVTRELRAHLAQRFRLPERPPSA
jgi:glycerol-3-phosphate dehydrogenase